MNHHNIIDLVKYIPEYFDYNDALIINITKAVSDLNQKNIELKGYNLTYELRDSAFKFNTELKIRNNLDLFIPNEFYQKMNASIIYDRLRKEEDIIEFSLLFNELFDQDNSLNFIFNKCLENRCLNNIEILLSKFDKKSEDFCNNNTYIIETIKSLFLIYIIIISNDFLSEKDNKIEVSDRNIIYKNLDTIFTNIACVTSFLYHYYKQINISFNLNNKKEISKIKDELERVSENYVVTEIVQENSLFHLHNKVKNIDFKNEIIDFINNKEYSHIINIGHDKDDDYNTDLIHSENTLNYFLIEAKSSVNDLNTEIDNKPLITSINSKNKIYSELFYLSLNYEKMDKYPNYKNIFNKIIRFFNSKFNFYKELYSDTILDVIHNKNHFIGFKFINKIKNELFVVINYYDFILSYSTHLENRTELLKFYDNNPNHKMFFKNSYEFFNTSKNHNKIELFQYLQLIFSLKYIVDKNTMFFAGKPGSKARFNVKFNNALYNINSDFRKEFELLLKILNNSQITLSKEQTIELQSKGILNLSLAQKRHINHKYSLSL